MKALKNDEKGFLFHVKNCFCSEDIYNFVLNFWYIENRLDKKVKFNFKIYDVTDWTTNNCNTYIAQYIKSRRQENENWSVNRI